MYNHAVVRQQQQKKEKEMAFDTAASRVLSHLSTVPAHRCLTSQIGRDTVYSDGYGRRHKQEFDLLHLYSMHTVDTRYGKVLYMYMY